MADEDQARKLYGMKTREAADLLLKMGLSAFGQNGMEYLELLPALAVEMEPRDAIEAMLITQMAATHYAFSATSTRVAHANSSRTREAYERSMTRLSRTFLTQVGGLKKYRGKAHQKVRAERVEV